MIGIVILNYNNWSNTVNCINSINNIHIESDYKIYLVDNKSTVQITDDAKEIIKNNSVIFIEAENNNGYSAGNNIGIRTALKDGCTSIFISNNDIVFKSNVFDPMKDFLINNPDVGVVAPKILLPFGIMQETNMKCKLTIKGKYKYMLRNSVFKAFSRNFLEEFQIKESDLIESKYVDGVSGCFFAFSKKCIEKIGLFDENVFLYMEEYILSIKMEKAKLKTVILPELTVIHEHSQSTKSVPAFACSCMVESESYYLKKYLDANIFELLGIKIIRFFQYIFKCLKYKMYRENFTVFIKKLFKYL